MITQADARSISFWNFGSLALITYENLVGVAATTLIGLGIAWKVAPSLDRLSFGDDTAFHLGINVVKARWLALVALSLLAGGAVSTVGHYWFYRFSGSSYRSIYLWTFTSIARYSVSVDRKV
jgi:ABC-type Fe3+-siderophore transport system permease subunit